MYNILDPEVTPPSIVKVIKELDETKDEVITLLTEKNRILQSPTTQYEIPCTYNYHTNKTEMLEVPFLPEAVISRLTKDIEERQEYTKQLLEYVHAHYTKY